jgi:hypothetical protein
MKIEASITFCESVIVTVDSRSGTIARQRQRLLSWPLDDLLGFGTSLEKTIG